MAATRHRLRAARADARPSTIAQPARALRRPVRHGLQLLELRVDARRRAPHRARPDRRLAAHAAQPGAAHASTRRAPSIGSIGAQDARPTASRRSRGVADEPARERLRGARSTARATPTASPASAATSRSSRTYNSDPNLKIVTDPHIPGNQGPTFTGRPRVPEGQTFTPPARARPAPARRSSTSEAAARSKRRTVAAGLDRARRDRRRRRYFGFTKDNPFDEPATRSRRRSATSTTSSRTSPVRDRGRQRRQGHEGRARRARRRRRDRDDGDQGRGPADPRRRAGSRSARGSSSRATTSSTSSPARRRRRQLDGRRHDPGRSRPPRRCSSARCSRRCSATRARTCRRVLAGVRRARSTARAADGFNRSIQYWKPAFRDSAIVNDATLGLRSTTCRTTSRGARRVAEGLDRDPAALKALITDFAATAGAFAASRTQPRPRRSTSCRARCAPAAARSATLQRRVPAGAPPRRRRCGRPCARPGPALDAHAAARPAAARARPPARAARASSRDLRPTVPARSPSSTRGGVALQEQLRAARRAARTRSSLPWRERRRSRTRTSRPAGPVYQEALQAVRRASPPRAAPSTPTASTSARSRNSANYAYAARRRALLPHRPAAAGRQPAARPAARRRTAPDVPCETQEPPDLRSNAGAPPQATEINHERAGRGRAPREGAASARWSGCATSSSEPAGRAARARRRAARGLASSTTSRTRGGAAMKRAIRDAPPATSSRSSR